MLKHVVRMMQNNNIKFGNHIRLNAFTENTLER